MSANKRGDQKVYCSVADTEDYIEAYVSDGRLAVHIYEKDRQSAVVYLDVKGADEFIDNLCDQWGEAFNGE